MPVNVPYPPLS
ncbi:hypothetical protein YPPY54_2934, partial [Yersinia pestis PY-54]